MEKKWRRIGKGETIPTSSIIRPIDGGLPNISGSCFMMGQDCYYISVDDAYELLKGLPLETEEEAKERNEATIIKKLIGLVKETEFLSEENRASLLGWLEKQSEQKTCNDEHNPVWSEEDDRMMNDTLAVVDWYAGKHRNISVKVSNWLKLLKSRVLSSSLREFDKEEGNVINHLIAICDDAMCYDTFAGCSKKDIERYKSFLTNLKFGINPQPQTTWKPSDEQMKVLDAAVMHSHLTTAEYDGLVKLREQLKKLREE